MGSDNKPAAAQEAVAYLDIGAGGYLDLGSNLPEVQLLALPKGRHALGIIGTYGIDGYAAAPVAAAPVVDGRDVRSAIAGIEGSVAVGSDGEWVSVRRTARDAAVTALRNLSSDCAHIYAAYAEAKASTPAAQGIELAERVLALMVERGVLGRNGESYAAARALIDASPKGGSDALARAYGYLWHVNHPEDIPAGHPYMSADRAAVEARKELRDMLTHEQRGEGINWVRQKLLADMQPTSAEVGA